MFLFSNLYFHVILSSPLSYNNSFFTGCDQNRYSVNCRSNCPQKCKNYHCDAYNGLCIHGCSNNQYVSPGCTGKAQTMLVKDFNAVEHV